MQATRSARPDDDFVALFIHVVIDCGDQGS
jgi:hypothetical protein